MWRERERFAVTLTPLEAAVASARRVADDPTLPPLLLADVADNPGGGGRGNTTFLLEALQTGGISGALLGNFVDPKLAEEAHFRKVGKRFNATFNRGGHIGFTRRYMTEATVVALSDGKCVGTRGIWAGRALDVGPSARARSGRDHGGGHQPAQAMRRPGVLRHARSRRRRGAGGRGQEPGAFPRRLRRVFSARAHPRGRCPRPDLADAEPLQVSEFARRGLPAGPAGPLARGVTAAPRPPVWPKSPLTIVEIVPTYAFVPSRCGAEW
ncbi:MAG: MlrC C-terminal domain-containing protein [Pseudomonadota bacterium]